MKQRLVEEVGKTKRLEVLTHLRRTDGMGVRELSNMLDMSYMGVKQHCLELERMGYLRAESRANPTGSGRPELVYKVSAKAAELFSEDSRDVGLLLLDAARALLANWATLNPKEVEKIQKHARAIMAALKCEMQNPKDGNTIILGG